MSWKADCGLGGGGVRFVKSIESERLALCGVQFPARFIPERGTWSGKAWLGEARHGRARQGPARPGEARLGMAWPGKARQGEVFKCLLFI